MSDGDKKVNLRLTHNLKDKLEQLKSLGANPCCDCVRCQQGIRDCTCAVCTKSGGKAPELPGQ